MRALLEVDQSAYESLSLNEIFDVLRDKPRGHQDAVDRINRLLTREQQQALIIRLLSFGRQPTDEEMEAILDDILFHDEEEPTSSSVEPDAHRAV